ncbi:MAG: hypothetical protein U0V73_16300 [Acidimicrobiia bacterium]
MTIDEALPPALEYPTVEPESAIELRWNPEQDVRRRLLPGPPHVAELYHVNAALDAFRLGEIAPPAEIEQVRETYLATSFGPTAGTEPDAWRELCTDLGDPVAACLASVHDVPSVRAALFGADICWLDGSQLWRVAATRPVLVREAAVFPEHLEELAASTVEPPRSTRLVAIVLCPWRYMSLVGPRGYRRALVDAGILVSHLATSAADLRFAWRVHHDFVDRAVNRVLLADGVERAAVVLLEPEA